MALKQTEECVQTLLAFDRQFTSAPVNSSPFQRRRSNAAVAINATQGAAKTRKALHKSAIAVIPGRRSRALRLTVAEPWPPHSHFQRSRIERALTSVGGAVT